MLAGNNLALVNGQRAFMNGAIGLAQQDIINFVAFSRNFSDKEFERLVKNNYGVIAASYGDLIKDESKKYYQDFRKANGYDVNTSLQGPARKDFYDLRKDASINSNTAFKHSAGLLELEKQLVNDVVKTLNGYQHITVGMLGFDDDDFEGSRRMPRANACAFCRVKAMEFSVYTDKKAITKLDSIQLHKSCRCVPAPELKLMDDKALLTTEQEKFEDEWYDYIKSKEDNYFSKASINRNIADFRKEFGYKK